MLNSLSASALQKDEKLKELSWNYFQISNSPSHALLHVRSGIHLYALEQVPPHQQHNQYITSGYRSYLSARQCLKSVLIRSNEFVNIWTHGGMVVVLLVLLLYDQTFLLPSMKTTITDHLVFLSYTVCTVICMICSAGYHTFNSHVHKKVAFRWYAVDLYGITVAMLGCYAMGLYYGFYCVHNLRVLYTSVIFLMMLGTGLVMLHPSYLTPDFRCYRLTHLSSVCLFGLLPTLHWVCASPKLEVQIFLPAVLIFYLILGAAMVIYVTKFPECFKPGSFNFIGQSHNWWHILINVALLYWRGFALRILQYRLSNQCVYTIAA